MPEGARVWTASPATFGIISFCRVVGTPGQTRREASLMAFIRALGKQAPADGLRVVAINPGPVETERHVRYGVDDQRRGVTAATGLTVGGLTALALIRSSD